MPPTEKHKRRRRSQQPAAEVEASTAGKSIVFLVVLIPILSTIGYGAVDMWAVGLLSIISAVVVVLWIIDARGESGLRFNTSPMQLPIAGLIAIAVIQMLPFGNADVSPGLLSVPAVDTLSMDAYATRFFLIRLVIALIFFAAALAYIDGRRRIRNIALTIIIFGAVMAFAGILQRLASPDAIYGMRPTPQAIPFGPFVNQHHFAAFMEMTGGLTLGIILCGGLNRDKNALLAIAGVLMAIAVLMTGSRGGFLGMLGVTGFVAAARFLAVRRHSDQTQSRTSMLGAAAAGAGLLIIIAGAVLFLGGGSPLLRGLGFADGQADITSGRSHFWGVAWQIFLDHPVLGAGFDAFGAAFSKYDTWNGFFRIEQAHNDYLQMLADGGVLAFACVAAFIFLFFRRGLQVINKSSDAFRRGIAIGSMAGAFGILIHSVFDFPLRTLSNSFFFLLLIVLATASAGDEREEGA